MNKKSIALILSCLILSGCAGADTKPAATSGTTTAVTSTEKSSESTPVTTGDVTTGTTTEAVTTGATSDESAETSDVVVIEPTVTTSREENTIPVFTDFNSSYSKFSTSLLNGVCLEDIQNNKNVMLSPESIAFAMAMTANGANGDTQKQMLDIIAPGLDMSTENEALSAIMKRVKSDNVITSENYVAASEYSLLEKYGNGSSLVDSEIAMLSEDGKRAYNDITIIHENGDDYENPGISADELEWFENYISELRYEDDGAGYAKNGVKFNIANSIWSNATKLKVHPEYLSLLQDVFYSEINSEVFTPDETSKHVNDWVNLNTDGMIPSVIKPEQITDESAMILVNAMSFEGSWTDAGDVYVMSNKEFRNGENETEQADYLNYGGTGIFTDGKANAFVKYYHHDEGTKQYAFMGILPNEGISVSDYIAYLDDNGFDKLWNSRNNQEYMTTWERTYDDGHTETYEKAMPCSEVKFSGNIPKFKFDYTAEQLVNYFKNAGMVLPFGPADNQIPDFSSMGEIIDSDGMFLFISDIIHKTHIELDEYGTKAAAVTAVLTDVANCAFDPISESQIPVNINLERPFVFAIVDVEEGLPVFIGVVNTIVD